MLRLYIISFFMKKSIFVIMVVLALMTSCKGGKSLKPECSGAAYELLWVIDDDVYNSAAGDSMKMYLEGPTPYLPQPEPVFTISRIEHNLYDRLLQTTRNILFVNVDKTQYTKVSIKLKHDLWANNQAVCYVNAPSIEALEEAFTCTDGACSVSTGDKIVEFFVAAERERMHQYYLANLNRTANDTIYELFDCNLAIPTSLNKYKTGEHFLWISNGSQVASQNIVMYSVKYYSKEQLTHEAILARRDSVMKANIPGEFEGSYMGTEVKHLYPETQFIEHNGEWGAVTRGLWRMQNGASMGGPFVSLTRVDKVSKRIVTVEGFVYAPSRTKRNLLRQMDAMVYSLLTADDLYKQRQEQQKKDTIK